MKTAQRPALARHDSPYAGAAWTLFAPPPPGHLGDAERSCCFPLKQLILNGERSLGEILPAANGEDG
jgi:hypothetical protein